MSKLKSFGFNNYKIYIKVINIHQITNHAELYLKSYKRVIKKYFRNKTKINQYIFLTQIWFGECN